MKKKTNIGRGEGSSFVQPFKSCFISRFREKVRNQFIDEWSDVRDERN